MLRSGALVASAVLSLFTATAVSAEVRMTVRRDGSKVIYNVPSGKGSSRGSDLAHLAKLRNRSSEFDAIIEKHCKSYNVDPVLAKAVIQVESNFNPAVVSHKGARGLMQLMPGTAKRFDVARIHDPDQNIRGGVAYLAVLSRMFRNDLQRVLAAYNAGENAVLRYGGIPPYQETQQYVQRALTVYYGRPYGGAGTIQMKGGRGGKLGGGFKAATRDTVTVIASAAMPRSKRTPSR